MGDCSSDPTISDTVIHIHVLDEETEEIVRVNSSLLAQHSPFFQKLFTTEMRGSKQTSFELHVDNASEMDCLRQLLQFICNGEEVLASSCLDEILYILIVADKFEVTSCIAGCMDKLFRGPMTTDLALKCFEMLPMISQVQPLKAVCEKFLEKNMRLVDCSDLPTSVMEILLKSDEFHSKATSEYDIYQMLLRWAEASEEHQLSLFKFMDYIRFSIMPVADIRRLYENIKLKQVLVNEFNRKKIKSLSMNGLFNLAEVGPSQAVEVVLEKDMEMHVGKHVFASLADLTKLRVKFWVKLPMRACYLQRQAREVVKARLGVPVERQRIWAWKCVGPKHVIKEDDMTEVVPMPGQSLYLYSEAADMKPDTETQTLTFVTIYDPGSAVKPQSMSYVGRLWVDCKASFSEVADQVKKSTGCFNSEIHQVVNDNVMEKEYAKIEHGVILCCEKFTSYSYFRRAQDYILMNAKL